MAVAVEAALAGTGDRWDTVNAVVPEGGGRGRGRVQACKERDNTAPEDPRASVRSTTDYRCSLNTQLRNVSPMYSTLKSLCVCLSDCSSAYLGAELV